MALPSALALREIVDDTDIVASDHRNNYNDIQTGFNNLLDILDNGVSGQFLKGVGSTVSFDYPPGYEYGYTEFTAPATTVATTEATATTIVTAPAITFDGSTAVWIEFFVPEAYINTANRSMFFDLYDGAASIGFLGDITGTVSTTGGPVTLKRKLTPAAATKTYSVRAHVGGGAATGNLTAGLGTGVGLYVPGFIRITKA